MFKLLFVAALLAAPLAAFADDVDESDVVVLTADNFESTLKDNEFVLVEFYAPWCGHCKRLIPEYAKAATALKADGVVLGKVDATVETDLASKYEVRGYPTLKFFRSGEAQEYNGPREADGIATWCRKKSGPPSKQLDGADDVAAFVADAKLAVVGAFKERSGVLYNLFMTAAKSAKLDDFSFADHAGAADDAITLHTAHADPQAYSGEGDLVEFVLANGYPLVDEIPEAWNRYQAKGHPLAILFVENDNSEHDAALDAVRAAAEKVKGKFSFSFADGVRFKQQIDRMGHPADAKLPVLAAMKLTGKANFPYNGDLDADAIAKWAESIVDGSLEPHMRSEDVPADNDGAVTVVVGKTFNDYAKSADKDVFLEIYAPWCGHCKSLAPVWEQLGDKFKDDANVVIAKIDGTANDFDVEYRGFPTLKFFPAGGDMIDYDGGRDLDALEAFVNKERKSTPAAGGDDKKEL